MARLGLEVYSFVFHHQSLFLFFLLFFFFFVHRSPFHVYPEDELYLYYYPMRKEGYERPQYDMNRHQNGTHTHIWDGAKGTENLVGKPPPTSHKGKSRKMVFINVVILHGYPPNFNILQIHSNHCYV